MKGHIGFTGTQRGMTEHQKAELRKWLILKQDEFTHFHHGDCVGADAEAHLIATELGYVPEIHPPDNPTKRAGMKAEVIHPVKPYLERNHDIVDACDEMIACPGERIEQLRSGTWATVRYTRKRNKRLLILLPQ